MWTKNETIGIIGMGMMGSAMAERFSELGYRVIGSRRNEFTHDHVETTTNNNYLVKNSDIVIITVKQKDLEDLSRDVEIELQDKIMIFIVAGVEIQNINKLFKYSKNFRAMTNLAFGGGKAGSAFCYNSNIEENDIQVVERLLKDGGKVNKIEEKDMTAFTLSSCLVGWLSDIGDSCVSTLVNELGIDKRLATDMMVSALESTHYTAHKNNGDFQKTRDSVSSKGGMTEAGLKIMQERRFKDIITETLITAQKRGIALNIQRKQLVTNST